MEFLNLQHSGENDSELAQKKENFDNQVLIVRHNAKQFGNKEEQKRVVEPEVTSKIDEPHVVKLLKPTLKTPQEIEECYLKPS